ncbi:MAG: putative rane protein [Herbinix sp.]|jgi:hypothetical protein|nr:putative rane protein [Herbinix sp.]
MDQNLEVIKGGIRMLLNELCRFIGQTVTIFTTSGGASGCGFTGVLLRVNPNYVTLVNRIGTPPTNPLSEVVCGGNGRGSEDRPVYTVGSVCDIPVDKIAAFCHNAI